MIFKFKLFLSLLALTSANVVIEDQILSTVNNHLDPNYIDPCSLNDDCFQTFKDAIYEVVDISNKFDENKEARRKGMRGIRHVKIDESTTKFLQKCLDDKKCKDKYLKLQQDLRDLNNNEERADYFNEDKVNFPKTLSKAEALVKLWNAATPVGMGYLHSHHQPTIEEAEDHLKNSNYVDYFYGKPIKTDFSSYPNLESRLYDRDAGEGMMLKVAKDHYVNKGPSDIDVTTDLLVKLIESYKSSELGYPIRSNLHALLVKERKEEQKDLFKSNDKEKKNVCDEKTNSDIDNEDNLSGFILNFLQEPRFEIKEGLEHYTEKIDVFFKGRKNGKKTITLNEFEKMFHEAEKNYFKDIPKPVMITLGMIAPPEIRLLYILDRWTS